MIQDIAQEIQEKKAAIGAKLNDHLKLNWPEARCPLCHANEWITSGHIFQLGEDAGALALFPSPGRLPTIAVVCGNCGVTFLLNAKIIGLVDDDEGGKG